MDLVEPPLEVPAAEGERKEPCLNGLIVPEAVQELLQLSENVAASAGNDTKPLEISTQVEMEIQAAELPLAMVDVVGAGSEPGQAGNPGEEEATAKIPTPGPPNEGGANGVMMELEVVAQGVLDVGPSAALGEPKRKRARRKERVYSKREEEDIEEAQIAAAMGFPEDELTEEEIEAGVVQTLGGDEQSIYIIVRNSILARWRKNVQRWLGPEEKVTSKFFSQHRRLAQKAYRFLHSNGYINSGVAPALKEHFRPLGPDSSTIIVIGAGLAGLTAARQLVAFGHKVVVLEGRGRSGGRVHTKLLEGSGQSAAADLGGSVISGDEGNPLCVLAHQLDIPLQPIRWQTCPLFKADGSPADPEVDKRVEATYNELLERSSQYRQDHQVADSVSLGTAIETFRADHSETDEERALMDWHLAHLEFANAGSLMELSLKWWDQDDPYEMKGNHCFLEGGNGRLVEALAEGLPIFYNHTVSRIKYSDSGVEVTCETSGRKFEGDMVLCTVPLGVLKRNLICFEPELPQRKRESIRRLGFGLLNKVAMLFPCNFWGAELDCFGHLEKDKASRGEFFMFYSYANVAGGYMLMAFVAGDAAHMFENVSAEEAREKVLTVLKDIFEPKGVTVPRPLSVVCTRWGRDAYAFGSYSHVAVGATGDDYDVLAESVDEGRLFFAGEHTMRRYPATLHGALFSGLREAGKIDRAARQRVGGGQYVARGVPAGLQDYAAALEEAFQRPDMEFGSFAVVLDPRNPAADAPALLKVVIRGVGQKGAPPPELTVFTLLTREQAQELQEVKGGNEARVKVLVEKFGVKLAGRNGLGSAADSLLLSLRLSKAAVAPSRGLHRTHERKHGTKERKLALGIESSKAVEARC